MTYELCQWEIGMTANIMRLIKGEISSVMREVPGTLLALAEGPGYFSKASVYTDWCLQ